MYVLTEDALVLCNHQTGRVGLVATQALVTIDGRKVLVATDPESRPVSGCPIAAPLKLCTTTLAVQRGYSSLVTIDGRAVCLDTVTGLTDGTPPARYEVRDAGQALVKEVG